MFNNDGHLQTFNDKFISRKSFEHAKKIIPCSLYDPLFSNLKFIWNFHDQDTPCCMTAGFCLRRFISKSNRTGSNPKLVSSTMRKAFWIVSYNSMEPRPRHPATHPPLKKHLNVGDSFPTKRRNEHGLKSLPFAIITAFS